MHHAGAAGNVIVLRHHMHKDFDRWNTLKKAVNAADETKRVYFHEGDIWWVRLGVNVGYEIDGKDRDFARPVIVLRPPHWEEESMPWDGVDAFQIQAVWVEA